MVRRTSLFFPTQFVLLLATVSLGLYFLFAMGHRTLQGYQLKQEEAQVQREVRALEVKRQALIAERDRLKTDTDIEKVAREELNLIKPGETAVIVLASKEAAEPAKQEETPPQVHEDAPFWSSWWSWLFGR